MKLIAMLSVVALITGCSTVEYVRVPFPEPSEKLMAKPAELTTIRDMQRRFTQADFKDESRISDVTLNAIVKNVTQNYGTCHEYKEQINSLQEWIIEQRKANNAK